MDETPRDVSESTDKIEAEIAETREEMRETISAIQDRLAPSQVLQRAKESAREATVGRVKQMAHELGEKAGNMSDTMSSAASSGGSALPLAMIGVGLAWLAARNWPSVRNREWTGTNTDWSDDPWMEDEWQGGNRTLSALPRSARTPPSTGHGVGDTASRGVERVRGAAADGAQRMSRAARRTQSGLERALRQNPMAVGMATLAAGLAVGALLPRTETEDEYLGATRDSMIDMAKETAESTVRNMTGTGGEGEPQQPQPSQPGPATT